MHAQSHDPSVTFTISHHLDPFPACSINNASASLSTCSSSTGCEHRATCYETQGSSQSCENDSTEGAFLLYILPCIHHRRVLALMVRQSERSISRFCASILASTCTTLPLPSASVLPRHSPYAVNVHLRCLFGLFVVLRRILWAAGHSTPRAARIMHAS